MRISAAALLLAVTLLGGCSPSGRISTGVSGNEPIEAYKGDLEAVYWYTEGVKYLTLKEDHDSAFLLLQKAIDIDSLYAPAYYEAARALVAINPYLALAYSHTASRLDSTNLWYSSQLGRLMVINRQYGNALSIYEKLLKDSPHDPENYRMLAALYEQQRQPFKAISVLDSAEYKLGKMEELSTYKRELLINVRLFDKAITETQEMIRDFPYKYDNYLVLGELYADTGKDSLALANFNKALELNPGGVDVIIALNEYYKRKGDNRGFLATTKKLFESDELAVESKVAFFNTLTLNRDFYRDYFFQISDLASGLLVMYPRNEDVVELYANNLIAYGNIEEALSFYKGYISNPENVTVTLYNNILDIEAYLGRMDSVDRYAAEALEKFPNNVDLYVRHGGVLSFLKQDRKAIDSFEQALRHARTDSVRSSVMGILGDTYHQMGDSKKSYKCYEDALRLWPDNIVVLNNYAYFLSEENRRLDKALEMSHRVMQLEPGNPTYMDTYGWILYKLGRFEEARKVVQQAVSLDRRGSADILFHYGDILFALGENFMATIYWNKALEAGYDSDRVKERTEKVK